MPFAAPSMNDDEMQKQKDKNGAQPNVSGESTSFSTGVPGQETAGSKHISGSGAKFANIQGYLDANKSQGDQMGQQSVCGQWFEMFADDVSFRICIAACARF